MGVITKSVDVLGGLEATKWEVLTSRLNHKTNTVVITAIGYKDETQRSAAIEASTNSVQVSALQSRGAQADYDGTLSWSETEITTVSGSFLQGGTVA